MEENEQKVINSIGSKDEITEPHVKQIISAFDGKKFLAEDIDKFKQLEKTFREILQLDDGENVINKLTGDITKMITSGVAIQLNNGTVSIGQVATIVLNMSADRLKQSIEIEENAKQEKAKAAQAETDAMTNNNSTVNANNGFESKEEFDKFNDDLLNLFEGLGVNLSDEDKEALKRENEDLMERGTKRDKDGNYVDEEAHKALCTLKNMQEHSDRKTILEGLDSIIEYYENELKKIEEVIENTENGKLNSNLNNRTLANLRDKKELYEKMIQIYSMDKEALLAHEECEPEEVMGQSAELIKEYVSLKKEEDGLDEVEDGENINRIKTRRTNILKSQETIKIDEEMEYIKERLEVIKNKLKSAPEEEKDQLEKRYDLYYGKLCVCLSKKEKIEGYLDESSKMYEQRKYGQVPSYKLALVAGKGDSLTRTDAALQTARRINDKYIDRNGRISVLERQANFYGKNALFLSKKDISQVAVESLLGRFERISKKTAGLINKSTSEQDKMAAFKQYIESRESFSRELRSLNITPEYQKEIMSQFMIFDGVFDPEEFQALMIKYKIEFNEERGRRVPIMEEMLEKLERNKDVFTELIGKVLEDPEKQEKYAEIAKVFHESLDSNYVAYNDMKEASSESELLKLFSDAFDKRFGNDKQIDSKVKMYVEEILKSIYDERGKDGVLALYENRQVTRDYLYRLEKSMRSINLEKRVNERLGEEDRVVFGRVSDDGKSVEGKWPEFLTANTQKYLEVMLAMRKDLRSEDDIVNTLLQLDPEAARNAYSMYELIQNKKLLEDPRIGDEEKAAIEDRNKEIIEMKYQLYTQRIKHQLNKYREKVESSTDVEYRQYYDQEIKRCNELLEIAAKQKEDFDITQAQIMMPDEEIANENYQRSGRKIGETKRVTQNGEGERKFKKMPVPPRVAKSKKRYRAGPKLKAMQERSKVESEVSQEGANSETIKLANVIGKTQRMALGEINRTTQETNEIGTQEIEREEDGKTAEGSIEGMSV